MDQTAKQLTRGIVSLIEEVNRKLGVRFEVVAIHGEPERHRDNPHAWIEVDDLEARKMLEISYSGFPEFPLSAKERKACSGLSFCERSYKTLGLNASEIAQLA